MRIPLAVCLLALSACAASPPTIDTAGADAVLLGEQHDAVAHPGLQEQWVRTLAQRGMLEAVALEMAERGTSTASLPRGASEAEVQRTLRWNMEAWPWERYRLPVMAAVRAGVPVLGANLPRDGMRAAMGDAAFDRLLPGPALKAQQQAIRLGHCELLQESQITPMTRVQIARDVAMAETIAAALRPGKTVLLVAGSGHVQADVGVPRHLPAAVAVRPVVLPREESGKDHCAELREKFQRRAAPPS